jgi:hypothetical protein
LIADSIPVIADRFPSARAAAPSPHARNPRCADLTAWLGISDTNFDVETVVLLDRSQDPMIVSPLVSNKMIQKGLDLRREQSVTVPA